MPPTSLIGALTVASLGLALAACGGGGSGDSAEDIRIELAEQFEEEGLDADASDCFAGVLVDEIGAEELADVDFSAEEPPEDLQDDFAQAATVAIERCDIDAAELGG